MAERSAAEAKSNAEKMAAEAELKTLKAKEDKIRAQK
jgi:hypothetical protein